MAVVASAHREDDGLMPTPGSQGSNAMTRLAAAVLLLALFGSASCGGDKDPAPLAPIDPRPEPGKPPIDPRPDPDKPPIDPRPEPGKSPIDPRPK